MTIPSSLREAVRARFNGRCGYCGVSEVDVGSELEIDHFRPVTRGGDNNLDNLIYCCTTCNRFKSNYWPEEGTADQLRLLHPGEDDVSAHCVMTSDGILMGKTARGWFHIGWLKLNRRLLIRKRQQQQLEYAQLEALRHVAVTIDELKQRIRQLEQELEELYVQIEQHR